MKQALIDPMMKVADGVRVAEVCDVAFEVAEPYFWRGCDDGVVADAYYYKPETNEFAPVPEPTPVGAPTISTGSMPSTIL